MPPETETIARGMQLLDRYLKTDPSVVETVEETAREFLDIARESQKQAMGETGDIDPKTVC